MIFDTYANPLIDGAAIYSVLNGSVCVREREHGEAREPTRDADSLDADEPSQGLHARESPIPFRLASLVDGSVLL